MSSSLRLLACFSLIFVGVAHEAWAQPGRGGRGRGMFGQEVSTLELLMQDGIRQEIELIDDQEVQLREIGEEFGRTIRSAFEDMGDVQGPERFERIREVMQEKRKEFEEKINDVLLDHQVSRLKQLQVQARMRRGGAANALGSEQMRDALELTDEQMEEIQDVAREAEEEMRKKILEAQKEARKKILGVLTPEQRRKWEEMVGASYDFESNRFGRGRRGEEGRRERGERGRRGGRERQLD